MLWQIAIGLILSTLIGYVGYRRAALSRGGWLGAMITGTIIFGFGGLAGGALLVVFFASSSILTHFKEAAKAEVVANFSKGGQRDLGQALANGGVATIAALILGLTQNPIGFAALVGALAEANADTWATELGVLSKRLPRLITSGRIVDAGTSGGVTALGLIATAIGAGVIGLLAALFQSNGRLIWIGLIAGSIGALFDSLIGATVQCIYYSDARHTETEKPIELDGAPNRLLRGFVFINNDVVNFVSTLIGAVVSAIVFSAIVV
jgi:uncharacterized protein (TIGR00297 family)